MSEANRQTESNDPVPAGSGTAAARSFRIVVRFFDERESELRPASRREVAWESPARQCRGCAVERTSPAEPALSKRRAPKGMARSHERITQ
jgi:hypothetical protein